MILDILMFAVGGTAVWLGAEGMVRGAVKLAEHWGIPSLIIGITIIAFGTSAPELVVSSFAAARGASQIALGNVIGSNIINIGLVLGLSAVISPIVVTTQIIKRDIPVVIAVTFVVVLMAWWGDQVSRIDGAILLIFFVVYSILSYKLALREQVRMTTSPGWSRPELESRDIAFLIGGTVTLAVGAEGMVRGAVGVAEQVGIDQRTIGMTIVAFGTSVPELAASVVAARHGESDLALGNVVGSNLYNTLLILGTASLISPIPSEVNGASFDFLFFVLFAVLLAPMALLGRRFGRIDGVIILAIYGLFTVILFV